MGLIANTGLSNTFDFWRQRTNDVNSRLESLSGQNDTLTLTGNVVVDTSTFVVNTTTDRVGIGKATPLKTLDVLGETAISANLVVNTSTLYVDAANDRVGIACTTPTVVLDVVGAAEFSSTLDVTGLSTLATLTTTGLSTIDTLSVTGVSTLDTLSVTGVSTLSSIAALSVTGVSTLADTLAVTGASTFANTVAVTGVATLSSNVIITSTSNLTANVMFDNTSTILDSTNVRDALIEVGNRRNNTGFGLTYFNGEAITFSAGGCWDSTDTIYMSFVGSMAKNFNFLWSPGDTAGGMDVGTDPNCLNPSEIIHFYAIRRDSDGSVDFVGSEASNWAGVNKTQLTGYTYGRHIGAASTWTDSNLNVFTEVDGDYAYLGNLPMLIATGAAQAQNTYHLFDALYMPPNVVGRGHIDISSSPPSAYLLAAVKPSSTVGGTGAFNLISLNTFIAYAASFPYTEQVNDAGQLCYAMAHNSSGGTAGAYVTIWAMGYYYPDRFFEV